MSEENFNCDEKKKKCLMKYVGVICATLLGAFLAFYVVADMTIKHMMDPMYQFKRMDKMLNQHSQEMDKMDRRIMKGMGILDYRKPVVIVEKGDDEYRLIIDLKPFNNNEKNVNFEVNDNMVTISASIEKEKRNEERIINFSQTFYLEGDLDVSKIRKQKMSGKYIITIPEK